MPARLIANGLARESWVAFLILTQNQVNLINFGQMLRLKGNNQREFVIKPLISIYFIGYSHVPDSRPTTEQLSRKCPVHYNESHIRTEARAQCGAVFYALVSEIPHWQYPFLRH